MKYGVILARFQPIHNGHIALIKKACSENDKVVILIGSADKLNDRNPIPINIRVEFVNETLKQHNLTDKCIVVAFNDLSTEGDNSFEWGFYLYSSIVDIIKQSNFTMYYSDGYEIITQWFPAIIMRNYVSLSLLARGSVESGISATDVRQYIINNSSKLEECVPEIVLENRKLIETFIKLSKK